MQRSLIAQGTFGFHHQSMQLADCLPASSLFLSNRHLSAVAYRLANQPLAQISP
jgi:hypothetical protein